MYPRIEAVTVCVNYSDFLVETIDANRAFFDRWIIVTTPTDKDTLNLCHSHNMEVLTTNDFTMHGDTFNKGRAIERGLGMLAHKDWLLHIDADVALPGDFRESLEDADLDPGCIYGADRLMVKSWQDWQRMKNEGFLRRGWHCVVRSNGYSVGDRWADVRYGYVPIGYFQLWHQSADHRHGIRLRRYPDNHQNAARADVKFALQWDRRNRQILPEVFVAHLESAPSKLGENWDGRKTPRFVSPTCPWPHPHPHPHPRPCPS